MALHRTVEAVSVVREGKVVSFAANRDVDLSDDEVKALGDKVVRAEAANSMFPKAVIIPAGFVPEGPAKEVDPKSLVSSIPTPAKVAKVEDKK